MKRRTGLLCLVLSAFAATTQAAVFLNEVLVNPPGSYDDTREFIELQGTPGMKLDGYAVTLVNGEVSKDHPPGSVPPFPANQEVDEFFSLDGLSLGANGLLVIGVGVQGNYPTILSDTRFQRWNSLWNGGLDTTGKLQNDGSNTILLIRNRPGRTQANQGTVPQSDLRWGKDVEADAEVLNSATRTFCSGGTRAGKHCECPDDCPGGGVCQAMDFCASGDNDGNHCTSAADCTGGGTCVSSAILTGNGSLDQGPRCVGGTNDGAACTVADDCPGGSCQTLLDMRGSSTPSDVSDDLEVVDEVSWDGGGWEYDMDDRHVDAGVCSGGTNNGSLCDRNCDCPGGTCVAGSMKGLPRRRVHSLDNPQGFTPDLVSRVDYRTKGSGWTPAPGARGELPNGRNWQDTATEQWIRGESTVGTGGVGAAPQFFYDVSANTNPDAIQPYLVNVPFWLNDGTAPDFNFATAYAYQIMAGRVNPLSIPFIPGDADRDGDCDADDIAKVAAVFGNDNWIFSNSHKDTPEGDSGDPATQTRPWDVDATGDNGIEASDLQWVLNFQGNTTGRIVGGKYDSDTPTPAGGGVYLNSNAAVACVVTASLQPPAGRTLSTLQVGDQVTMTVSARMTGGGNTSAGQENGIMQFVQNVAIGTAGVVEVKGISAVSPFQTTQAAIQVLEGSAGDRGVASVNGYTTSFTQGLSAAVPLYRVTLRAKGVGSANVAVAPAAAAKFAASTPFGLKVGHTNQNGNPNAASYPSVQTLTVVPAPAPVKPDLDLDGDVDADDLILFAHCLTGPGIPYNPLSLPSGCTVTPDAQGKIPADVDGDGDVDQDDFGVYQRCFTGSDQGPPAAGCDQMQ